MFLTTIAHTGRIAVPHPDQEPSALHQMLEEDVIARESAHRLNLVSPVPVFDVESGLWASHTFFRCCQFLVFRDIDAHSISTILDKPPPKSPSPSICYSVDVAFSFLPDLFRLASGISPDDPLVLGIRKLAAAWPLSSVGIPNDDPIDLSPFFDDPSLRELYVHRIMQRKDKKLATLPEVSAAIRQAVGAYPELAPELISTLKQETAQ